VLIGLLGMLVVGSVSFSGGFRGWMGAHRWMMSAPPAAWTRQNPLPVTDSVLAQGRFFYERFCVSCHGPRGNGDGPAAVGLRPRPPALAVTGRYTMLPDGYFFWRIKEGGRAWGTPMPAFDSLLTDTEIWSVVAYMRAGFPEQRVGDVPVRPQEHGGLP